MSRNLLPTFSSKDLPTSLKAGAGQPDVGQERQVHLGWSQQASERKPENGKLTWTLGMKEEAGQAGESQMWRALKDAEAWSQETHLLAFSLLPLPAMSKSRSQLCRIWTSLSCRAFSVMFESSCGQRGTASICYPCPTSGCFIGSSFPQTPHILSAGPVHPPLPPPPTRSDPPQAFATFKTWKSNLTTPSTFQPPPSPSPFHKQAPGMNHWHHLVIPPPTTTSFCPILLLIPPLHFDHIHQWMSDRPNQ